MNMVDLKRKEFLCPLCRQFANGVMPLIPPSVKLSSASACMQSSTSACKHSSSSEPRAEVPHMGLELSLVHESLSSERSDRERSDADLAHNDREREQLALFAVARILPAIYETLFASVQTPSCSPASSFPYDFPDSTFSHALGILSNSLLSLYFESIFQFPYFLLSPRAFPTKSIFIFTC